LRARRLDGRVFGEGYEVVGFDIEAHDYGTGGYPGKLQLRDILTLHGSELKDAACIVGSSPCQKYSYMAMPWKLAKEMAAWYADKAHPERRIELNALFDAQFRIQREASEAAGRHIPMVVENVCGAQKWVGRASWNYGSFYLWGDVPALMPMVKKGAMKGCVGTINSSGKQRQQSSWDRGQKGIPHRTAGHWTNPAEHENGNKGDWLKWDKETGKRVCSGQRATSSGSKARKRASAMIAKIPFPLAQHIARSFKPQL
jgi:hypothetical protein